MREKVTVARKWASPEIKAFISNEEVGASIALDDFLKALAVEVGNPTFLVTVSALEKALLNARAAVLKEMKFMTKFVV